MGIILKMAEFPIYKIWMDLKKKKILDIKQTFLFLKKKNCFYFGPLLIYIMLCVLACQTAVLKTVILLPERLATTRLARLTL